MNHEEILDRVQTAYDRLAEALEAGKSETLMEYLKMCSRFHQYSFGNCLLICLQRPDATHVAGFHKWKELKRFVRKGEKGIAILAPLTRKRVVERKLEDGSKEAREVRAVSGFRTVFVFDVSQTDGERLPEFATSQGDPGQLISQLESLIGRRGISLSYETIPGGANGMSTGGAISVRPDLSLSETFRVLIHEVAHEILHKTERRMETTKTVRELEAEAVAFIVASTFGIDSTTRSSDYIQLYAGDKEALMQSLDQIQKTAANIIEELSSSRTEVAHAFAD